MKKILTAVALTAGLMTAACGQQDYVQAADPCLQAQNPQECAQVRDAGGDVGQYLLAGLGGYMLAKMMTPSGPRYYMQPNPSYHGAFRPIPSYDRSYSYVRRPGYRPYSAIHRTTLSSYPTKRVVTRTVTKTSPWSGKTHTTTTRTTYRSSPSASTWRSSSSRSSWSSGSSFRSSRSGRR